MDIATDWYEAREMDDGIVLITERHAAPLASCNMWLVRGRDRDVLIDTGTGASPLLPFVLGLTGREPLASSRTAITIISAPRTSSPNAGLTPPRWKSWPRADAVRARGGGMAGSTQFHGPSPDTGFDAATHDIRPAPATHLVDDGDEIELGDRRLNVLHLPGHSAGSIGLYEAESGIVFTADALYDGPKPCPPAGLEPRRFRGELAADRRTRDPQGPSRSSRQLRCRPASSINRSKAKFLNSYQDRSSYNPRLRRTVTSRVSNASQPGSE